MNSPLNDLRDKAYAYAKRQGFHDWGKKLSEYLMLIVSELAEVQEADRKDKWCGLKEDFYHYSPTELSKEFYEDNVRGTVEEEVADAMIRLFDLAGLYDIDLDWHVKAKMAYNETRPHLHGKKY